MSEMIKAPFTPEQVRHLNEFQACGYFHPFTCGGQSRTDSAVHGDGEGKLVATVRGWICPYCDYTQEWAHDFMGQPLPPNPMSQHGWTLLELLIALGCLCLIALIGIVILIIAYKSVKG